MGYVSDTQMSQFITPAMMAKSAGTWTPTVANNIVSDVRTANASAFNLVIPIQLPSHAINNTGVRLKSIDVYWKNGTADLAGFATVDMNKFTLPADTAAPSGAAVAVTVDTGNDSEAKRVTQAQHTMTVTLDSPEWLPAGYAYALTLPFNCAAGSVVTLYGARINYDFRI